MDCIEFVVLILQECHAHGDGQAYDDLRDGSDFIQPGPEESVYGFDMLQDCLKVISSVNTELYSFKKGLKPMETLMHYTVPPPIMCHLLRSKPKWQVYQKQPSLYLHKDVGIKSKPVWFPNLPWPRFSSRFNAK